MTDGHQITPKPDKRRLYSRIAVVIIAGIGGALFYWQSLTYPVEHQFTVVLTGVEVPLGETMLRHEDIQRYEIKVLSMDGELLAEIKHRRPSAITSPAPVRLARGQYAFHIILDFKGPNGAAIRRNLIRHETLLGGDFRIEL
jgi:hypothetical protein